MYATIAGYRSTSIYPATIVYKLLSKNVSSDIGKLVELFLLIILYIFLFCF